MMYAKSVDESKRHREDEEEGEGEDVAESEEKVMKPRTWVKNVRVVRDKDTQLGKGFAYIEFAVSTSLLT